MTRRYATPGFHSGACSASELRVGEERSNVRYPAQFSFAGEILECEVRFRDGRTSCKYQKKNWKVWFEEPSNPVGVRELNLNAYYSTYESPAGASCVYLSSVTIED